MGIAMVLLAVGGPVRIFVYCTPILVIGESPNNELAWGFDEDVIPFFLMPSGPEVMQVILGHPVLVERDVFAALTTS
jgi:hypothetical protein